MATIYQKGTVVFNRESGRGEIRLSDPFYFVDKAEQLAIIEGIQVELAVVLKKLQESENALDRFHVNTALNRSRRERMTTSWGHYMNRIA